MATYTELYQEYRSDSALRNKVFIACQVLANTILQESNPSPTRKAWATGARDKPDDAVNEIFLPILIENQAATLAQIQAATDAAILTAVTTQVGRRYGGT